ncbi:nucleotide-binding universal stress UspA family protein [Solirubrobacter pauli]|uniref:Nucleotide-binding universal stress UspA family protein n=1 Tax=Solirubrobacter pauli TaxID=166793 RepID=A0A660L2C4_9ACTN|nr:universal stress protein [Solirubrobacter pauli]RKQ87079.1 nucleotide-binding universal stress UspA family protein [Solirubrobacter pauli]
MTASPVILCYDGSDDAAVAIQRAAALFGGRPAVVLVAWPRAQAQLTYAWPGMVYAEDLDALDKAAADAAAELAERGATLAREAGLDAEPMAMRASGPIWQAILAAADDRDAAAIVLGSRGLSGIRSLVLGSVSNAVVHHATRPTLVVRHGCPAEDQDVAQAA